MPIFTYCAVTVLVLLLFLLIFYPSFISKHSWWIKGICVISFYIVILCYPTRPVFLYTATMLLVLFIFVKMSNIYIIWMETRTNEIATFYGKTVIPVFCYDANANAMKLDTKVYIYIYIYCIENWRINCNIGNCILLVFLIYYQCKS